MPFASSELHSGYGWSAEALMLHRTLSGGGSGGAIMHWAEGMGPQFNRLLAD